MLCWAVLDAVLIYVYTLLLPYFQKERRYLEDEGVTNQVIDRLNVAIDNWKATKQVREEGETRGRRGRRGE